MTTSAGFDASAAAPEEPGRQPWIEAFPEGETTWDAGEPTAALAAPGACVLGEAFEPRPLLRRVALGTDTQVLTFGLFGDGAPLNLATCACVLARHGDVVRPYTPVSTNAMRGKFEIMVKIYPDGAMSQHLANLPIMGWVDFKHVPFNVKIQYPFGAPKIGMLVGGTGITPMLQALHAILGTAGDATEVALIYGSRTAANVLAGDVLDAWAANHPRLKVLHVLSHEPADSGWAGARGFVDAALVEDHCPKPGSGGLVFVCGPPPMYDALCGPRDAADVTGVLGGLGYARDEVYTF